jgi:hypothetical protein
MEGEIRTSKSGGEYEENNFHEYVEQNLIPCFVTSTYASENSNKKKNEIMLFPGE